MSKKSSFMPAPQETIRQSSDCSQQPHNLVKMIMKKKTIQGDKENSSILIQKSKMGDDSESVMNSTKNKISSSMAFSD
jgi:hypothetical protein